MSVKKCKKCGCLPMHNSELDYHTRLMVYVFYCPKCGAYGEEKNDKEEAMISWNSLQMECI